MSKTLWALIFKMAMTFVAGLLTLTLIDGNAWWTVLIIAAVATALNYVVGDQLVLPAWGNVTAAIGDGLMAAIVAWVIALAWPAVAVSWISLLVFAIIVAVGEYFFHNYLLSSEEVAP